MEAVLNKGDGAMLETLLKAGATLREPDKILEKATKQDDYKSASFILALIDAGAKADVNTLPVEVSSSYSRTLLYQVNATLLHRAADEVNLTDVKLLLAHGANPNAPGKKAKDDQKEPYGMTPLMAAANSAGGKGNATVKRLLDAGADVHAKDSAGNCVIYYAACGGLRADFDDDYIHRVSEKIEADILHMVEQLIKAGADVPKDILAEEWLRPEISPAGREKLALMLLDAGADPLAKSESGETTLMRNGIYGPKIAKRLLDAGVDPTVKCGETSAMSLAMEEGAVEVVKLLKEKGIDPGELRVVDPEKIEPLLKLGTRIPKDMTDLLLGDHMKCGHGGKSARLYEDYIDIIQILKKHGYKPELMAWAKKDHSDDGSCNTEALRAFFKTGENPNETDENDNSLLGNYISSAKSAWMVAGVLPAFFEAGVDLNHKNKDGKSILQLAKEQKLGNNVIKLLQKHGAKE